jgi:hypothetical protein
VIYLVDFRVYIVLVYRPPSNCVGDNVGLVRFLLDFCGDKEVVVMGDFNLPGIDWSREDGMFLEYGGLSGVFVDVFSSLGLVQWVTSSTFPRSGNILDLVFTSEEDRVGDVVIVPPFPSCGHCGVLLDYNFQSFPEDVDAVSRRSWFKGKYNRIDGVLSGVDWGYELADLSVDGMYSRILEILRPLVERFVPVDNGSRRFVSVSQPPARLKRERACAWRQFKDVRRVHGRAAVQTTDALSVFDDVNDRFRNFFIHRRISYEQSLVDKIGESPKCFHSYVRSKKVGNPSVGPLRLDDGTLVVSGGAMADVLADSFASVYTDGVPVLPIYHQQFPGNFEFAPLTMADVAVKFSKLDVNSSMGPDGVHPLLLRSCSGLVLPFFMLFSKSLHDGVLPSSWKESRIVPLFKRGSRYVPLNYRPISLTSVCCKTLERVISEQLYDYLDGHDLLSPDQFGFRRGHTVDDQLLLTYGEVTRWLDCGRVVDVVLFDFAKAFDTVCHDILLHKLERLGVAGSLLAWIRDFLVGRSMRVSVSGISSGSRRVGSGVPQGSVLGPLLFLIYVNFLPSALLCRCKIFADDLKLYLRVSHDSLFNMALDVSRCQRDIDEICSVSDSWGLKLNAEKCVVLRFQRGVVAWDCVRPLDAYRIGGSDLKFVQCHKDLGVSVDVSLRFHVHIRMSVNRAAALSANLLKTTLCRSAEFMMQLFISHIRPLIDFASPVWNTGYIADLKLLESVQRRWTKNVDGLREFPYAYRLEVLNLYSIKGRLLRADILKCWKIFHGKCSIRPGDIFVMAPHVGTRGHRFKLAHLASTLECRRRFFSLRCVKVWNSLPDEVVSLESMTSFKFNLHTVLGGLLFDYVD